MKKLEEIIKKHGRLLDGGVLKVDSFLNHKINITLLNDMGKEFAELFKGHGINKILTVEASGIGIACICAQYFGNCEVLFAKKNQTKNLDENTYSAKVTSFTHGKDYIIRVSKEYLTSKDRVLIIDDFLAEGQATLGLISLTEQAGAALCGVGICIEKAFQGGGRILRERGINLHSLAIISLDKSGSLSFIDDSDAKKILLAEQHGK